MANESDIMTISSEGSTMLTAKRARNVPLHERCSMNDMLKIREVFEEAYTHTLLPTQFREMLRTVINVEFDDDEFNILFLKVSY